jgi:hypothetical protein|nr:MAG TPA: hypothetical protein [Bacteriophage sp.]
MEYKIIQTTYNGDVYEQKTTSYNKMYGIVIQMVGLDYSYIRKVKVENDVVTIDIQPGEGKADQSLHELKKLYIIHATEMMKRKKKQMDYLYKFYQEIGEEFWEYDPELIESVKMGVSDL